MSEAHREVTNCFYVRTVHLYCLIFINVPTNAHIYIVQDHITVAPACSGDSAPSSGSLYVLFAEVMKY